MVNLSALDGTDFSSLRARAIHSMCSSISCVLAISILRSRRMVSIAGPFRSSAVFRGCPFFDVTAITTTQISSKPKSPTRGYFGPIPCAHWLACGSMGWQLTVHGVAGDSSRIFETINPTMYGIIAILGMITVFKKHFPSSQNGNGEFRFTPSNIKPTQFVAKHVDQ